MSRVAWVRRSKVGVLETQQIGLKLLQCHVCRFKERRDLFAILNLHVFETFPTDRGRDFSTFCRDRH